MNSQNNHINNEVVRQEQEKQKLGLSGGMQLKSYKDDTAKKVMGITRKGVAQFEADEKLIDIKDSVDRFKVDRYFNDLSTSIANVINNYLQGVKQNDTGDIISKYNELAMYLKTVINWKKLSENDKNLIVAKFNELLPQVNELMDVAITERYTDAKQIEELKNNLVVRNYVPVLYVNYAEAIKAKKPDYETRKMLSTKLFTLLNEPLLDEAVKREIEDKIEIYDEARNKFVSAKNKERKQFYKGILERQDKELSAYIDGIFRSIPKIPERGISDPELDISGLAPLPFVKPSRLTREGAEKARLERIAQKIAEKTGQVERPSRKPRNKEEERKQLEEFSMRKYFEGQEEEDARDNIAFLEKTAEQNFASMKEDFENNISRLEDELRYNIEQLSRKEEQETKKYADDNAQLEIRKNEYDRLQKIITKYKSDNIARKGRTKDVSAVAENKRRTDEYNKANAEIVRYNISDIVKKQDDNDKQISSIRRFYQNEIMKLQRQSKLDKQRLGKEYKSLAGKEEKQTLKDIMQQMKLVPEAQMEFSKKKGDVLQRLREREFELKQQRERNKPVFKRRKEERAIIDEYEKEMRKEDRERRAEQVRERAKQIKEEQQRLMEQEAEMFGMPEQPRLTGLGEGRRRRGRGLKNAVRKPLSMKNPNENDKNIELYPQYDLSKYDGEVIKRR